MFYEDVLTALSDARIPYLLVGGLAVNFYGVPRMTMDIDVVVSTRREDIETLVSTLSALGYQSRLPEDPLGMADPARVRQWRVDKNLKAFSFFHPGSGYRVVDIVLDHPLDWEAAYDRRQIYQWGRVLISLISLEDLIAMKRASGRPQDLSDVAHLERQRDS